MQILNENSGPLEKDLTVAVERGKLNQFDFIVEKWMNFW